MIYLIVQKWNNTKNNHAGMFHLGKLLTQNFPKQYFLISIPDLKISKKGFFPYLYNFVISNFLWHSCYILISLYLFIKSKKGDTLILLEYLTPGIRQDYIPRLLIFFRRSKIRIYAFIHLTPSILDKSFSHFKISKRLELLTGGFTYGSSLTNYLKKHTNKSIITFLHYSDLNFYRPSDLFSPINQLNILVIGQQARNYANLSKLVNIVNYANFYIIVSDRKIVNDLLKFKNVNIYSNIKEKDLLQIMEACHCSLGFYNDVVGSNVLSNCISMGIISLVNDVGSVRDYLTDIDSFFCNNINEYINALNILNTDHQKVMNMRKFLLDKRNDLNFEYFHHKLLSLLNK